MNVLIIGHGNVGTVLARLLKKDKRIKRICCADKRIHRDIPGKRVSFRKVDASDKKQVMMLIAYTRPDIVVNASLPNFNRIIMECCLKKSAKYLDLASYWDIDPKKHARSPYKVEQLEFDARFRKKGLVGLINAGISPGLTNLFCSECICHLDRATDIRIRLVEDTGSDNLHFAWSKEWLLDELNWKPLVYRNRKFKIAENFAEEEIFNFPEPFGRKKVALVSQEEVGTIPLYFNVQNVDIKAYDNQISLVRPLVDLGLTSEKKVSFSSVRMSPFEFLAEALPDSPEMHKNPKLDNAVFAFTVEVEGKKHRKDRKIRLSAVFPKQKAINKLRLGANFISYPTALAAYLFIVNFDSIKRKGVFSPEALDRDIRKEIVRSLVANGVTIKRNF